MKQKIGAWLDSKMHLLRVGLIKRGWLPQERLHHTTRQEMLQLYERLEVQYGLMVDEKGEAWRRWENSSRIANDMSMMRMKIIENLDRFGMTLNADNEIVVRGPRMTPAVVRNGVVIKPAQMVPILAKGLKHDAPPPFQGDLLPVICWFRVIPDEKIKGKFNEEFSHYEDADMILQDPKNRKNKKMIVKLPTENVPPPRGGTKFSGKWVWRQQLRTDEVSPKIIDVR